MYDGDGNRVKSNVNGTVTVFIGNYYEWETKATRKHYYAGTNRIAMRDGETLYYLFGDHLGSTSLSYRVSDGYVARHLYKPWGEKRYPAGASVLPTKYRFTGQYVQNELWLYYYNARWYDNRVGRFIQADIDIPESQGVQGWDRYSYVNNNPLVYVDSNGQFAWPVVIGAVLFIGSACIAYDILTVAPINDHPASQPTSNDMTGWLTARINENSSSPATQLLRENFTSGDPIKMAGAIKAWVAMVRPEAIWDYKVDILKYLQLQGNNKTITLGGMKLNYQAIANINFGALGRAIGMPSWMLESEAGAFHFLQNFPKGIGTYRTYFDDPFDNWMIKFGEWLFDHYGDDFGKLTPELLEEALNKYLDENDFPEGNLSN
jgi:RHS repeat-associated protein